MVGEVGFFTFRPETGETKMSKPKSLKKPLKTSVPTEKWTAFRPCGQPQVGAPKGLYAGFGEAGNQQTLIMPFGKRFALLCPARDLGNRVLSQIALEHNQRSRCQDYVGRRRCRDSHRRVANHGRLHITHDTRVLLEGHLLVAPEFEMGLL